MLFLSKLNIGTIAVKETAYTVKAMLSLVSTRINRADLSSERMTA